jgi:hypothetical protein
MPELSETAVGVLRFRAKGYRMPVSDRSLGAFLELADAGIMEPVPGETDFRFTEKGWERRDDLLREAEERIDRIRHGVPDGRTLSESARSLLRRILSGEQVEVAANKETYRELARAGIMYPVSGFVGGPESSFRFTAEGWNRRDKWIAPRAESP